MWPCGIVDAVGGEFDDPTWSPSGGGLAWAEGDGIWTTPVPDACATPLAPRRVIEGGRDPHWGPADPGSAAAAPGDGGNPQRPQAAPSGAASLAAPRSVARAALRRRGVVATVSCPGACTVEASLRVGARRVAKRSASSATAGDVALRLRTARRVGRLLTLSVRVAVDGAAPQTLTKRVAVR
jgi:hypothetical protein